MHPNPHGWYRQWRSKVVPVVTRRKLNQVSVIRQEDESNIFTEVAGWRYVTVANSPLWKRTLWLFITLVAFGLCGYQLIERFIHFVDDPSKVDVYYVHNRTLQFPAITICPFNKEHPFPSINPFLALEKFKEIFPENITVNATRYITQTVIELVRSERISIGDLWSLSQLGFQKLEFYVSDAEENDKIPSNSFEVTEIFTTAGICIKLSAKRNLYTVGGDTTMKIIAYDIKMRSAFTYAQHMAEETAFKIFFSHRNWVIDLQNNLFDFHIRLEEQIYRNRRSGQCREVSASVQCLIECLEKLILSSVSQKCRLPYMRITSKAPPCKTWKQLKEVRAATLSITGTFHSQNCNCPRKCRDVIYDIEYSDFWHDSSYEDNTVTWSVNVPESMIRVNREQRMYSSVDLFSDFGGTLGLYLGLCLLNILEISVASVSKLARYVARKKQLPGFMPKPRRPQAIVIRKKLTGEDDPLQKIAGFNNVFKKNNSIRVRYLWLAISLLALSSAVYQCSERIAYFLSEPVSTNVYYVYNETIRFPSVVVCPVRKDGFIPSVHPSYVIQKVGGNISHSSLKQLVQNGTITIDDLWNMSKFFRGNHFIKYSLKHTMSDVRTLLGTCKYVSPAAGNDFKYDGSNTGYVFYFPALNHEKYRVIYLSPEELPALKYLALHSGITPHAVYLNDVLLIDKVVNLNTRRNPCADGEVVSKCLAGCIYKTIISQVQAPCRLPYMQDSTEIADCASVQEIEAMLNVTITVVNHFKREECNCPRKCNEFLYTVDVTRHGTRGDSLIVVWIKVFSNRILVIQEGTIYNVVSLMSDIGSCLSLFLGLCGLRILELLTHITSLLIAVYERYKKKVASAQRNRTIVIRGGNNKIVRSPTLDIPGFTQIVKSKSWWGSIMWTSISIMAVVTTTYQCAERIGYFLSDTSVVKIYFASNETILFPILVQFYWTDFSDDVLSSFMFRPQAILKQFNQTAIFREKLKAHQLSIMNLWNLTRLKIFSNRFWFSDIISDDIINLSEVTLTQGFGLLFQPSKSVAYNGGQTIIRSSIFTEEIERKRRIFMNTVILSANEDKKLAAYLLPKYGFWTRGNVELIVRITNIVRRNTSSNPCEDGQRVVRCLAACFDKVLMMSKHVLHDPCRLPYMKESSEFPMCNNSRNGIYEYIKESNTKIVSLNAYDCSCPKKCNEVSYVIEDLEDSADEDLGRHDWKITIPTNKITVMREEAAYTFFKLLSDLGGAAGLLFGLGFLQIIELVAAGATQLLEIRQLIFHHNY